MNGVGGAHIFLLAACATLPNPAQPCITQTPRLPSQTQHKTGQPGPIQSNRSQPNPSQPSEAQRSTAQPSPAQPSPSPIQHSQAQSQPGNYEC